MYLHLSTGVLHPPSFPCYLRVDLVDPILRYDGRAKVRSYVGAYIQGCVVDEATLCPHYIV